MGLEFGDRLMLIDGDFVPSAGGEWIDSVNPDIPKKPSLVFLIFGGLLYLAVAGFASTFFHASSGSARSDIMRKIGRPED